MVITASGGKLSHSQASNCWDQTIFPLGKKLGLLTGYVRAQEGTSKRTAAGDPELQRKWYGLLTKMFERIYERAKEVLGNEADAKRMMPSLICNLDEECLNAMGKNYKVVGSTNRKKHDNQHASSRHVFFAL